MKTNFWKNLIWSYSHFDITHLCQNRIWKQTKWHHPNVLFSVILVGIKFRFVIYFHLIYLSICVNLSQHKTHIPSKENCSEERKKNWGWHFIVWSKETFYVTLTWALWFYGEFVIWKTLRQNPIMNEQPWTLCGRKQEERKLQYLWRMFPGMF